jgi:hypothetical protein
MKVVLLISVAAFAGFAQNNPLFSTEVVPVKSLTAANRPISLEPVPEKSPTHARKWWIVSGVALTAASLADFGTSVGRNEMNPLLQTSAGQFSAAKAAGLKIGISSVTLLVQALIARRKPELYAPCAVANFVGAGAFGAAAAHNR